MTFLLELPEGPGALPRRLAAAGLHLAARRVPVEEARALPTAWAKRLGWSGRPRAFWALEGVAHGRGEGGVGAPQGPHGVDPSLDHRA